MSLRLPGLAEEGRYRCIAKNAVGQQLSGA